MENKNVVNVISETDIKEKIYTIRDVQVMLDSDLAKLYGVETKALNQAVKRNQERFPESFCFQVSTEDIKCSRSQFVTLKANRRGSNRGAKISPQVGEAKDIYLMFLQSKGFIC